MYPLIGSRSTLRPPPKAKAGAFGLLLPLVLTLCVLALSGACGRKTLPRPPELVAPRVLQGVTVTNQVEGVRIGWRRPTQYADGSRMLDLGGFQVERSSGNEAFEVIATLQVSDRDRFRQIRKFRYLDENVSEGQLYRYRVTSYTTDAYFSPPSAVVELVRSLPEAGDD